MLISKKRLIFIPGIGGIMNSPSGPEKKKKKKVDAFLEKMPISCEKRIRSIKKLSKVRKYDAENQQKIAFNTLSCEKASFHQYHHF